MFNPSFPSPLRAGEGREAGRISGIGVNCYWVKTVSFETLQA